MILITLFKYITRNTNIAYILINVASLILHFQSNKSVPKTTYYQKFKYRLSIWVNPLKYAVKLILFQSTIVHHVKIVSTQREESSKLNFMHNHFKLFILN